MRSAYRLLSRRGADRFFQEFYYNAPAARRQEEKTGLTSPLFCAIIPKQCGISSSGRVTASQAVGGEFETRIPLQKPKALRLGLFSLRCAENSLTNAWVSAKIFQQSFRWLLHSHRMVNAGSRNSKIVMSTYIKYGSRDHDRERGEIT